MEPLWLLGSWLLAMVLLVYLHEEWQPGRALIAALLGGVLLRRLLRSNYDRFPSFLRLNFDVGVALLGVLLASWGTLVLYPAPYWVLKWRPAVALPSAAIFLGLALASLLVQQVRFEGAIAAHRDREAALREETLRAQLAALQAQINPHFLFNSFNALAELTHSDPVAAETLVQDLAHLLRYTLRASARERVPLALELEAVERYLRVEEARLGPRLRVERNIDPGLTELQIPGLLLQPLVENAVRHAVSPRPEGGIVAYTARRSGDGLLLIVEDDGPGLPPAQQELLASGTPAARRDEGSEGAGGGLSNVMQRVALSYRGEARLSYRARAEGGSRLELALPL